VDEERWAAFDERRARYQRNLRRLHTQSVKVGNVTVRAAEALRQPEIRLRHLIDSGQIAVECTGAGADLDMLSLETELKYQGYLKRQEAEIERLRREDSRPIPTDFQFAGVPGLSREVVQRLSQVRPGTIGQAGRVPGVTPAAVAVISAFMGRHRLRRPDRHTAPAAVEGGE
jgi:tRNA uridine 5-carboxymethylaminomethyl modification enzyme